MADDDDFERQLQQEAAERERQEDDTVSVVNSGTTRVEDDGTVMEFDVEKRAWFPKVQQCIMIYHQTWDQFLSVINSTYFYYLLYIFYSRKHN